MGRVGLIALVLMAWPIPARGDATQLAREELKQYLGEAALRVEVSVNANISNGGEAFSINGNNDAIKITGSNQHMALCGAYHLIETAGYRFLAPKFAFYQGSAEFDPAKAKFELNVDAPIVKKPKL